MADPNGDVPGAVQDQRGHANARQYVSHIATGIHVHQRSVRARARRPPLEHSKPPSKLGIGSNGGSEGVHRVVTTPVRDLRLDVSVQHRRRVAPRVVNCLGHPSEGPVQHERRDPLGVAGREQHRHLPALRQPEQRCPFRPSGVHDRAQVLHPVLERRRPLNRIRHAEAAAIEEDQSAEGGQPTKAVRNGGILPRHLDMRDIPEDRDQVERTIAHDLIGDVEVVSRPHVAGLGDLGHRDRFCRKPA